MGARKPGTDADTEKDATQLGVSGPNPVRAIAHVNTGTYVEAKRGMKRDEKWRILVVSAHRDCF